MANNNETTTKFKVDISELKKAMQDAKRSIAVANSEFKAVSSSMDDWGKSTDGISAKLKQLDSNLKSQKTILSSLEAQYDAVVKEQGEGSAAADRLKIAINNQKAVINKTEREISGYQESLKEVSEAEKIAAKSGKEVSEVLDDMGDKAEDAEGGFTVLKGAVATFAGNVLTSLAGSIKNAATSLLGLAESTREYREQMNKLESASADAGYGIDYTKEKYKELYGVLGDETAANTTVSNFMAMGLEQGQLNALINSATGIWAKYGDSIPLDGLAESINETAKVGQVTGGLADALNWAGISEDEFNESLAECTNEQARQKLIIAILNKTYGDLGNSYKETNKSVIEAREAQAEYTDTMAELGEKAEPVTTALQKGFNSLLGELLKLVSGVDMEEFTGKIEEGFKVLTDQVLPAVKDGFGWIIDNKDTLIAGLAGIAGGFVAFNVASTIMGVVKAFQAFKVAQEGATVAQWLMNAAMNANPIMLIVTLVAAVITAIVTFVATNDDARAKFTEIWQGITDFFSKAVEGIVNFFTKTIPEVFSNAIAWVKENFDLLLLFLINPFAGLFKYFYENNTKFKEFVDTAIKFLKELPVKAWTWLLNTINKVIQWRKDMITKAKEAALGFINKVIEYVSQLASKVWTWLVAVITKVTTWHKNLINKAKEAALGFINKVIEYVKTLPSKIQTHLTNAVNKVVSWGTSLASKGKEAATKLFNAVVDKIKEIPNSVKSIGKNIVEGLWNGINDKFKWLTDKIKGFANSVTDKLKEFFGIHSPSRVMRDEIGKWLPEGIAVGINKNAKSVLSSMKDLAVNTVGAARDNLSNASTTLGTTGSVRGGTVNNFYQTINSPKQLSRLEIYRQSKNLLGYAGGEM